MAELAVVRRYAQALFNTATQRGAVEQVEQDLKLLDQTLRTVPRLQRVLRAPVVPSSQKQNVVRQVFGNRVSELTLRFLEVAVQRRRESIFSDILAEYQRLANEARNILPVEVISAAALTDAERETLAKALAQQTGKQVLLHVNIEPKIIGGLVLRMGDTVVDGSIRTRLEQLRRKLTDGYAA